MCSVLGFCRDGDVRAIVLLAGEDDLAVDECVERVVLTDPDACTWVMLSTTLADDDVTSLGVLTTEEFYSESLAFLLASGIGSTNTSFMCPCVMCKKMR